MTETCGMPLELSQAGKTRHSAYQNQYRRFAPGKVLKGPGKLWGLRLGELRMPLCQGTVEGSMFRGMSKPPQSQPCMREALSAWQHTAGCFRGSLMHRSSCVSITSCMYMEPRNCSVLT